MAEQRGRVYGQIEVGIGVAVKGGIEDFANWSLSLFVTLSLSHLHSVSFAYRRTVPKESVKQSVTTSVGPSFGLGLRPLSPGTQTSGYVTNRRRPLFGPTRPVVTTVSADALNP